MGTPKVVFLAVILCLWGVTTEAFKLNSWIPKVFKEGRDPTLMELKEWNSTWIMPNEWNSSWIMPKEWNSTWIMPNEWNSSWIMPKEWNSSWIMSKERNLPLIQPKGMKSPLTMNRPFDRFVPKAVNTTTTTTTTTSSTTTPSTTTTSSTARSRSSGCKCGHVNTRNRIVGGNPTITHEYPWQVALTWPYSNTPFCGGSIISKQWILTAAHCLKGESRSSFHVVIGEHKTNSNSETSVTENRTISQIVMHPCYKSKTNDHDVALIKLRDRIVFNSNNKIAPVCLPPRGNLYNNVDATITGWGNNSEGFQPATLQEVTVPTMSNAQCKKKLDHHDITSNMICAGLAAGGKDSCGGDSGGPMVTPGNSAKTFMVQIGVVSWGYYGCARPNQPGVYARVTKHLSWIEQTTDGSSTCPKA